MAYDIRHEHHNSQAHQETTIPEHHHRAIIGFDKNEIPKVLVPADVHSHTHVDENRNVIEHTHEDSVTVDYMQAVAAYRKTFPSKQDVIDNTPDPAVKEMILRAEQLGINTVFDRFDAQQPQCSFGLSGSCCRICTIWVHVVSHQRVQEESVVLMSIRSFRDSYCVELLLVLHSTVCMQRGHPFSKMGSRRKTGCSDRRRIQDPYHGRGLWNQD